MTPWSACPFFQKLQGTTPPPFRPRHASRVSLYLSQSRPTRRGRGRRAVCAVRCGRRVRATRCSPTPPYRTRPTSNIVPRIMFSCTVIALTLCWRNTGARRLPLCIFPCSLARCISLTKLRVERPHASRTRSQIGPPSRLAKRSNTLGTILVVNIHVLRFLRHTLVFTVWGARGEVMDVNNKDGG